MYWELSVAVISVCGDGALHLVTDMDDAIAVSLNGVGILNSLLRLETSSMCTGNCL